MRLTGRALGLLLATGVASTAAAQVSRFDGQYVGELTLTGTINGECTPPPLGALYPLTISGGQVVFTYTPRFDTTLRGVVDNTGAFKASAHLKNGVALMTGQIRGSNLTAEIASPSCRYSLQTKN